MFYIASKLIGILLSPMTWIIFGLFLSLILLLKKSKHALKSLIATALLTSFLTNPFFASWAFHQWEKDQKNCVINTSRNYDIAIVLSGMVAYGENPKQANFGHSVDRILEACRLYHKGTISQILVTGGNASIQYTQPAEAEILRRFLIQMAIPDTAIIIEPKARNTYENALFTAELLNSKNLQDKEILLITSAYHMHRSFACFNRQDIEVYTLPVDFYAPDLKTDIGNLIWPTKDALNKWDILLHEWFGIFYYKLMGYI